MSEMKYFAEAVAAHFRFLAVFIFNKDVGNMMLWLELHIVGKSCSLSLYLFNNTSQFGAHWL